MKALSEVHLEQSKEADVAAPFAVKEGDVVLLVRTCTFAGTFMVVERVAAWGAAGHVPGVNGARYPFRAGWDDMLPTGGCLPDQTSPPSAVESEGA